MKEFVCFFCGEEADRIGYFTKDYPWGASTIENPTLCCSSCYLSPEMKAKTIDRDGGGISCLTFKGISGLSKKRIGFYLSRKFHEINHLSNPFWRKILFRIHYTHLPKRVIDDNPKLSGPVQRVR